MPTAVLSIGSNLGKRFEYLQTAVLKISTHPKISNVTFSSIYETKPVGGPAQDNFLNAVVQIETQLSATELLEFAHELENQAQRERNEHWGPRTLDVDILVYGDQVSSDSQLTLPHPRISERAFVIVPWFEVDPAAKIPELGSLKALFEQVDKTDVQLNRDMKLKVHA